MLAVDLGSYQGTGNRQCIRFTGRVMLQDRDHQILCIYWQEYNFVHGVSAGGFARLSAIIESFPGLSCSQETATNDFYHVFSIPEKVEFKVGVRTQ